MTALLDCPPDIDDDASVSPYYDDSSCGCGWWCSYGRERDRIPLRCPVRAARSTIPVMMIRRDDDSHLQRIVVWDGFQAFGGQYNEGIICDRKNEGANLLLPPK